MTYQLVVPIMTSVEELRVLQWHKNEGDSIEPDQLLLELETDKAIVEVRSPRACVLRRIDVSQGSWARAGHPMALFSDGPDEALAIDGADELMPLWEVI